MKTILVAAAAFFMLTALSGSVNAQYKSFTITNKTGITVTSVYISPAGKNVWGANLYPKRKLENNASFDFSQLVDNNSCSYDVKFRGIDGKDYYDRNVNLCSATGISLLKNDDAMHAKGTVFNPKLKLMDQKKE